jgi:tetratricopeptide (TPR) repeat protein
MDNILPDSTLKYKKAHCLGLTILYLMAAEKMKIKAYLVRGPEHVFPRLCEKKTCFNIEPLRGGRIVDDKFFIENLMITKQSIDSGIYLKNFDSPSELAASIYLGLGFVAGTNKQYDLAESLYKKAADNSQHLADVYSNLSVIYSLEGKQKEAELSLEKALQINPDYYPAIINLGAFFHNHNDLVNALKYYTKAITINYAAVDAYRRRAKLYKELHRDNDYRMDLERILIVEPKFCDVIREFIAINLDEKKKVTNELLLKKLENNHECLELSLH